MSILAVFEFNCNQVRILTINNEPWFVLVDLCKILEISNSRDVSARLDEDERGVDTIDTGNGRRDMTIVSESGMYSLVLTSRKPQAKVFKRWLTHEVLPSIRKTGRYESEQAAPDNLERIMNQPDPWKRFYEKDFCDRAFKWFGAQFYWSYIYSQFTPDEQCKINRLNPPVNGIRPEKIHQYITPEVKERLRTYIGKLVACIDVAPTREDFEIGYARHFGGKDQLRLKGL